MAHTFTSRPWPARRGCSLAATEQRHVPHALTLPWTSQLLNLSAKVRAPRPVSGRLLDLEDPQCRTVHIQRPLSDAVRREQGQLEQLCTSAPFREAVVWDGQGNLSQSSPVLQRLAAVPATQAQCRQDIKVRHARDTAHSHVLARQTRLTLLHELNVECSLWRSNTIRWPTCTSVFDCVRDCTVVGHASASSAYAS
jgi:hypothetical protein